MNSRCRVVLTREATRNRELATALANDARIVEVPLTTTEFRTTEEITRELNSLSHQGQYQTVAVTSARAARFVPVALLFASPDARVAVVGRATREAVLAVDGIDAQRVVDVPASPDSASLAKTIERGPVLFLRAQRVGTDLADVLAAKNMELDSIVCYQTLERHLNFSDRRRLRRAEIVVISAPSAWAVARRYVRTETLIVVSGDTTADAVLVDHALVRVAASPHVSDVAELVRQLSATQHRAVG